MVNAITQEKLEFLATCAVNYIFKELEEHGVYAFDRNANIVQIKETEWKNRTTKIRLQADADLSGMVPEELCTKSHIGAGKDFRSYETERKGFEIEITTEKDCGEHVQA